MGMLKVALPKGHLWSGVKSLLDRAGYGLRVEGERSYSVNSNDPELELRIHRAQNISPLVEEGKYDLGITGLDWVVEHRADVEELTDLELGRVNVVAAIPQRYGLQESSERGGVFEKFVEKLREEGKEKIIVASEYENITRNLCEEKMSALLYKFIRSYGATETFIGVADLIVDCTETGTTLRDNGWQIIHKLFTSTARLIANKQSLKDQRKKDKIESFLQLVAGARDAKGLKLIKLNVAAEALKDVLSLLPSMKSPTISQLAGDGKPGFAVEVAVKENQVVQLIPLLKKKGATDILEIDIDKVIR